LGDGGGGCADAAAGGGCTDAAASGGQLADQMAGDSPRRGIAAGESVALARDLRAGGGGRRPRPAGEGNRDGGSLHCSLNS
jgi:hypothetical protein